MSFHVTNSGIIFPGTKVSEITSVRSRADVNYVSTLLSGNGVAVAFAFTFTAPTTTATEISVYVERRKMVLTTDYTISGSVVTFVTAPKANTSVKIIGVPTANAMSSRGLAVVEGLNAKQGIVTLVGTGAVTVVPNTSVTAVSRILLTGQLDATGIEGFVRVTARTPGTSFTITSSSANDNAVIAYQIIEPA